MYMFIKSSHCTIYIKLFVKYTSVKLGRGLEIQR